MTASSTSASIEIDRGCCYILHIYDVAHAIDLDACEERITHSKRRHSIPRRRHAPRYLDYQPPPLCVTQRKDALAVLQHHTQPDVDLLIFEFGAVSVRYRIPITGPLAGLLELSEELYEHEALEEDSRRWVEELLTVIRSATVKPEISEAMEDYVIFEFEQFRPGPCPAGLVAQHARGIAQILRADATELSEQEIADALQSQISFGTEDLAIVDWNGAVLFDSAPEDIRSVLEFANVELLELRFLDGQLDNALEESYEALAKAKRRPRLFSPMSAELKHVAMMQVDSAMLFEGINNALKLLSDHYLARVYQLAAQRFHLKEWDETILRKINTLESIYEKMSNQAATLRLEILEWIIIILIAVSIAISFLPL